MKFIAIGLAILIVACGRSGHTFYRRSLPMATIDSGDSTSSANDQKNPIKKEKPAIHPNDGKVIPKEDIHYTQFENMPYLSESEIFRLSSMSPIKAEDLIAFREKPTHEVKVLQLSYFPLKPDGTLDHQETASPEKWTLGSLRARVEDLSSKTAAGLSKSTNPFGKNTPFLTYRIIEHKEFTKKIPVRKSTASTAFYPDHNKVLLEDVSICDYVDGLGVRDVWIFMYHRGIDVVPIESNMSMGTISSQYFNYPSRSFGDISNSYRENDLPQCINTYIVYEFNFNAGTGENLHNYGHQREALYRHIGGLIWETEFIRPYGHSNPSERIINHCGDVHHPMNAKHDYDYINKLPTLTHCNFWLQDHNDPFKYEALNCTTWNCDHHDWLIWWAQRIPGYGTKLIHKTRHFRNFHEFFADFDYAAALGFTLYDLQALDPETANAANPREVFCPENLSVKCEILKPLAKEIAGECGYISEDKNTGDANGQILFPFEHINICIEILTESIKGLLSDYPERVFLGKITRVRAAEILGICERSVTRMAKRIRRKGLKGIKHGNTGKRPSHAKEAALKAEVADKPVIWKDVSV